MCGASLLSTSYADCIRDAPLLLYAPESLDESEGASDSGGSTKSLVNDLLIDERARPSSDASTGEWRDTTGETL